MTITKTQTEHINALHISKSDSNTVKMALKDVCFKNV